MPKVQTAADSQPRKGPSYPYYNWAASLKIADAVKVLGGDRQPVAKGDIAHHLEMSEVSQALSQTIASARCYGMIEGYGEWTLTEFGRRYFYPEADSDKRHAELTFLNSPPVHAAIIKRFDGNILPPPRNLGTILKGMGVPVSWVDRSAAQFREACERLELIDPGGHLRFGFAYRSVHADRPRDRDAEMLSQPIEPHTEATANKPRPVPLAQDSLPRADSTTTVWSAPTPNGAVRVETPAQLTREAWVKLTRYVEILEPPQEEV